MISMKEIREKDDAQLVTEIASLKEELYQLRFEKATGTIENPNRIREVRKTIYLFVFIGSLFRILAFAVRMCTSL